MAVEVKLPRLGQGMESGTIVRWLKAEGDTVSKGEPLYELDTDKVTQEVEAESEGVLLKIVVSDGEVDVGTTVGVIGTQDEDVSELLAASQGGNGGSPAKAGAAPIESEAEVSAPVEPSGKLAQEEVSEEPATSPATAASADASAAAPSSGTAAPVKASPLARRIARERGVDIAALTGTGPDGRIIAEDVEGAAARAGAAIEAAPAAPASSPPGEVEVVELTSIRRTIARRLTEAWEAPVFQLTVTANAAELVATRERMVELMLEGETKPTVNDVLTRVVAAALMRHRPVNAHFTDGRVLRYPGANVGIAVAAPSGLVVPVIQDADRKSVQQIAATRIRSRFTRPRRKAEARRPRRRDLHDLEPRDVRNRAVHRRSQPTTGCDSRRRLDRGQTRGSGRRHRDRADHDDDSDLRPPCNRRLGGR